MRLFTFICLLLPSLLMGQKSKTTEQSFAIPSSKTAYMNLKFGRTIKINTWNKKEIVLKTTFKYSEDDFEQWYDQQVSQTGGTLEIETGFKNMKSRNKDNWSNCWSCEPSNKDCYCLEFSYEIFAPADVLLEVETISGDIEVPTWDGSLKAKSISGFIDLALTDKSQKDLRVKSVTGEIFTDLEAVQLDTKSTAYSKKINTSLNGGGKLLQLETVSGDIYLRKQEVAIND